MYSDKGTSSYFLTEKSSLNKGYNYTQHSWPLLEEKRWPLFERGLCLCRSQSQPGTVPAGQTAPCPQRPPLPLSGEPIHLAGSRGGQRLYIHAFCCSYMTERVRFPSKQHSLSSPNISCCIWCCILIYIFTRCSYSDNYVGNCLNLSYIFLKYWDWTRYIIV